MVLIRQRCVASVNKRSNLQGKQHTVAMLRAGKVIALENMQGGKYFRIVADVHVDGERLSEILIRSGLGVIYHGKSKSKNWCE